MEVSPQDPADHLQRGGTLPGLYPAFPYAAHGDIPHSQVDISLVTKLLGFEPLALFEDGLKRTWDWYKSAYGKK